MWKVQTYQVTAEPDAHAFVYLVYGHLTGLNEEFKSYVDKILGFMGDEFGESAMIYSPMGDYEAVISKQLQDKLGKNYTFQMGLLMTSSPLPNLDDKDSVHLVPFKKNDKQAFDEAIETVRRVVHEQVNFAHERKVSAHGRQQRAIPDDIFRRMWDAVSIKVPIAPSVSLDVKKLTAKR